MCQGIKLLKTLVFWHLVLCIPNKPVYSAHHPSLAPLAEVNVKRSVELHDVVLLILLPLRHPDSELGHLLARHRRHVHTILLAGLKCNIL